MHETTFISPVCKIPGLRHGDSSAVLFGDRGWVEPLDIVARWHNNTTMKKLMTSEIKLTVRLPKEMHAALVEAARTHNRSLNGEILTAVGDHLKKRSAEKR